VTGPVVATGVVAILLLGGCSASPASLEGRVGDEPGVVRVVAREDDGDPFPFARVPHRVRVLMEADASAEEVLAVFDAYEAEIDGGGVGSVEVVLEGPTRATLVTGAHTHATAGQAQALVAAQQRDEIVAYRQQSDPVLPSVEVTLAPVDLATVVSVADEYWVLEPVELVEVRSGDLYVSRDEVNEDVAVTFARERFAIRAGRRVPLTGAVVSGRGPLELATAPADLAALRAFVQSSRPREVGRVVVRRGPLL
jgi:hypothetical protein